ncbi:hypothetical protein FSARC_7023 [Fusarium sarcochroum]|uniref:PD-(D/E)XK nuclease-like domain-containing protein n=1 Tax=Fusarium sarcochroum TaxID=1208366 RepID=A0A8H4TW60_9HYPO|nr:hypothetical protein FSARC_7023 [Fusarium sarcochroum]
MEFDISLGQVTHWLDDIPAEFSHFESSPQVKSQGLLKRRRSSTSSKLQTSKRRQLISPPASQLQRRNSSSSKEMDVESTAISTPSKKRPADDPSNDDNEQTPRADSTRGRRGLIRKAPSISSQSSSAYSRDSKRSRGSQSPLKMWPLVGPSHKLVRAGPTASNAPRVPALRHLIDDFGKIERGRSIMPQRIKTSLEENDVTGLDDGMFFDDDAVTDRKSHPCSDDLVRQALRISKHSNTCSSQLQDEAAWNNLVHSRLLDLFLHDMHDGPGQDILDLMPCVTTNMNVAFHCFDEPASRVDYIVRLVPEPEEDLEDYQSFELLTTERMPTLNWTANQLLPIAFSIETKRYGGDIAKGEQQLGIWNAAAWEFLIFKAGEEGAREIDFIPGVVVNGDIWSLVVTTRNQSKTVRTPPFVPPKYFIDQDFQTVFPGIVFGNTRSIIGVFQVIAGLRRLRRWALEVLWPWYKRHLPGLADPSGQQ